MKLTDSGVYINELERTEVQYRLAKGDPCFDITVFMKEGEIVKLIICSGIGEHIELCGKNIVNATDVMREFVNRAFEMEEK